MKTIDRILYSHAKKAEESYKTADRDKRIVEHATSYMKAGKHRKIFAKTYFTDTQTTAEELECVINYGAVVGDENYYKYGTSEYYSHYVDAAIRNHLCKYLKDRVRWEQHHTLVDFADPEKDTAAENCDLMPESLEITNFNFVGLTDREIQAVIYYAYNFTDDYVAEVLGLSKNTIKTFRNRGLAKMRTTNNHQKLLDLSQPI